MRSLIWVCNTNHYDEYLVAGIALSGLTYRDLHPPAFYVQLSLSLRQGVL